MMSKQTTTLLIFSFLVLLACKQPPKEENADDGNTTEATSQAEQSNYPALGNQDISNLYAITDKADIIFYDLPISVNQDEAKSAKSSVLYISPAPVTMNKSCKPLGRISFMSDGAIVKEADIYADSLCHYFVFMENNKPIAANAMQESGVQFFKNIIAQVQQRK